MKSFLRLMDDERSVIKNPVKISQKQNNLFQLCAAGLILLIAVVLSSGITSFLLNLWFGVLWLLVAWRTGLSPVLTAALTFLALRSPLSSTIPQEWMLSVNLGMSVWVLSLYIQNIYLAPLAGLVWSLVAWMIPPLFLLVLTGLPKLSKIYGENHKWVSVPALISVSAFFGFQFTGDGPMLLIEPALAEETYQGLREFFLSLFSRGNLWLFIPIVGVFEMSQKQPDDHRFTWRNLMIIGALLSFLLAPAEPAIQMFYLLGIPISGIMLSRWSFTLPDLISRSVYWLGILLMSLSIMQGGVL